MQTRAPRLNFSDTEAPSIDHSVRVWSGSMREKRPQRVAGDTGHDGKMSVHRCGSCSGSEHSLNSQSRMVALKPTKLSVDETRSEASKGCSPPAPFPEFWPWPAASPEACSPRSRAAVTGRGHSGSGLPSRTSSAARSPAVDPSEWIHALGSILGERVAVTTRRFGWRVVVSLLMRGC